MPIVHFGASQPADRAISASMALASAYCVSQKGKLGAAVYDVPGDIDQEVASLKLKSMGIKLEKLTAEQKKYLSSWDIGT